VSGIPSITFPNDDGVGLLSVLYLLKQALEEGPTFRFHIGSSASIVGTYANDITEDDYYVIRVRTGNQPMNALVEIRLDSITEIEYL
jgi:hypothetical protein